MVHGMRRSLSPPHRRSYTDIDVYPFPGGNAGDFFAVQKMSAQKCTRYVRTLTDRDTENYRKLRLESIRESADFACPGVVRELTLYSRGRHDALSMNELEGGHVWGSHDGAALVGVIAASRFLMRDGVEFNLWGLYVSVEHRKSRVAQSLFRTALQWCHDQPGTEAVRIHLRRGEWRIRHWCQQNGFELVQDPALGSTQLLSLRLDLGTKPAPFALERRSGNVIQGDSAA